MKILFAVAACLGFAFVGDAQAARRVVVRQRVVVQQQRVVVKQRGVAVRVAAPGVRVRIR